MNTYTFTTLDGVEQPVTPGQDFTTELQRIDNQEEGDMLGAEIGAYVPCGVQHRAADLDGYDEQLLARWKITRTVVTEDPPQ